MYTMYSIDNCKALVPVLLALFHKQEQNMANSFMHDCNFYSDNVLSKLVDLKCYKVPFKIFNFYLKCEKFTTGN